MSDQLRELFGQQNATKSLHNSHCIKAKIFNINVIIAYDAIIPRPFKSFEW